MGHVGSVFLYDLSTDLTLVREKPDLTLVHTSPSHPNFEGRYICVFRFMCGGLSLHGLCLRTAAFLCSRRRTNAVRAGALVRGLAPSAARNSTRHTIVAEKN